MATAPTDPRPIRWGILGAGGIAEAVSHDIGLTSGNVIAAVAARDGRRATDFAARHGAGRGYGSYQDLVNDDEVDVVYIATTHPHHRDQALMAIAAGKAVLIEKPVTLDAADARTVFAAASRAGVFAMEAMWMRTNPLILQAQELIADGAIGEIRGLRHEFGLGLPYDPGHRVYDLANGGGALLDLGVYPATFAYLFLGAPDDVITTGQLAASGADDTVAMQWLYQGTPRAQLWCSVSTPAPNEAVILGSKGWITFAPPGFRPAELIVHAGDEEHRIADPLAGQGYGYGPEIEEVERCLRAGLGESPLVPHSDTIAVLELLDDARAVLGVHYPDKPPVPLP
jgi:predicted dehydrogenase